MRCQNQGHNQKTVVRGAGSAEAMHEFQQMLEKLSEAAQL